MITMYTKEEFNLAKGKSPLPIKCPQCNKIFYLRKDFIVQNLSPKRTKKQRGFCSLNCSNLFLSPPVIVLCEQCGKKFRKQPSQIKRSKHNFCCHSCAAIYSNAHKTKGTRVSKLEKWFQAVLPQIYPNIPFEFNLKNTINGELDIYIPSLKLAFEINGVFHYEPIYGKEKLSSMQTNDSRKMQACLEHNIELCIIDTSALKYFKENKAAKYLDIIKSIIDLKASIDKS